MKAVHYEAPGNFAVADMPMPAVGPLDVRIKIHQSGVCGTDLHLHHGTFIGTYPADTRSRDDEYGKALETLASDPAAHKVLITVAEP